MKYRDIKSKIIQSASQKKIPVLCEFELTSNCNFSCPMCFVHNNEKSLDTSTWISIFNSAIEAGMLFANLTGGEVFLRKDFNTLYEYLFDRGIKVTLFTNGSILKEDTLALLKHKKPHFIAITLYGHDEESYTSFTKCRDSFQMVLNNIKHLKESHINVILRTLPMRSIYTHLASMIDVVKGLNEKLYFSRYITHCNLSKDKNNRLNPKELIDFESKLNTAFNFTYLDATLEDTYKSCAALRGSLYINYLGDMLPCAYAIEPRENIIKKDFYQTFLSLSKTFIELENNNPCHSCEYLSNCMTCFARRSSEEGHNKCSNYLKSIAKEKSHYVKICDDIFYIDYKFDDYLKHNIESYCTKDIKEPIYYIRTNVTNKILLPNRKPNLTFSTRSIYHDDKTKSMYSVDSNKQVRYRFKRTLDFRETDLYLNTTCVDNLSELEYIFTGLAFLDICASNGKVPLHGSAIEHNNEAIILSAPSQTGKSTLANNYCKHYKEAEIFNDDKPIIYIKNHQMVAAGTPFCGKDTINRNRVVPLKAIIFLEQGETDTIIKLDSKEKLQYFMKNTLRPKSNDLWEKMLPTISMMIDRIDMYKATVTLSTNAPKMIHEEIYGGHRHES